MTTLIKYAIATLSLLSTYAFAQDFQGVATYKTHRAFDIKMDSTKINSDLQKQMIEMMKKQFQKTYKLTFNKEASLYKEEESLSKPQVGNGINVVAFSSSGGSDILYKNTKTNTYVDQKDTMGKIFLVKDSIQKIDWKLGSETKHIGEYQCFKATYTKMVPKPRKFTSGSLSKVEEKNKADKKPEMIERTVTAWYTPQIPVNNGPDDYQGLPGLILEVHDGKLTIVCSKIVLNPEEKIDIQAPTKGKAVSRKKYKKIMEKKSKEMMERYAPKRGSRKNGETISISISG